MTFDLGASDSATRVFSLPDGKILIAGLHATRPHWQTFVARVDPDGRLDATFGQGGSVVLGLDRNLGSPMAALDRDGSLVLAGRRDGERPELRVRRTHASDRRACPGVRQHCPAPATAMPSSGGLAASSSCPRSPRRRRRTIPVAAGRRDHRRSSSFGARALRNVITAVTRPGVRRRSRRNIATLTWASRQSESSSTALPFRNVAAAR
jgi:hypothetical protein